MSTREIQFLWFEGCPLAVEAREQLIQALDRIGGAIDYRLEDIDVHADGAPEDLNRWGSPTILIDGSDITGHTPGVGSTCRVYPYSGGVLPADVIIAALTGQEVPAHG